MSENHSEQVPLAVVEACPACGERLRVRRRKADGEPFLGCVGWPSCDYTADYDTRHQRLAARVLDLEAQLATATPRPDLARELRALIAFAHPDRWPRAPDLAHEVTARLTDLRRRCGP